MPDKPRTKSPIPGWERLAPGTLGPLATRSVEQSLNSYESELAQIQSGQVAPGYPGRIRELMNLIEWYRYWLDLP